MINVCWQITPPVNCVQVCLERTDVAECGVRSAHFPDDLRHWVTSRCIL